MRFNGTSFPDQELSPCYAVLLRLKAMDLHIPFKIKRHDSLGNLCLRYFSLWVIRLPEFWHGQLVQNPPDAGLGHLLAISSDAVGEND